MSAIPTEWIQALEKYPADPAFPDGKPLSIRIEELRAEGFTMGDAQDVAEGELSKLGIRLFPF